MAELTVFYKTEDGCNAVEFTDDMIDFSDGCIAFENCEGKTRWIPLDQVSRISTSGEMKPLKLQKAIELCGIQKWDSFYIRDVNMKACSLYDEEYVMGVNAPNSDMLSREVKRIIRYYESFLFVVTITD